MQQKEEQALRKQHTDIPRKANPADLLANERTFLAWIRTSIALMGFGFVVVKFALFIKQITFVLGKDHSVPSSGGYSGKVGVVLVIIGGVLALLAYVRFRVIEKQLIAQEFSPNQLLSLVLTIFIVSTSAVLIWYLLPGI